MNDYISTVKDALAGVATDVAVKTDRRVFAVVPRERIVETARILFKDLGMRFAIATATDTPRGIDILYHFSPDRHNMLVNVRVLVPKDDMTMDSITSVITGAAWIETEIHEMLGVTFRNHPGPDRLLLGADWPEGLYPLRRDDEDTKSTAAIRARLRREGLLTAED
jgi:Ni,Fe-hydrogenase III component G